MTALLSRLSAASFGLLLAQSAWGAVLVREPFNYEPPGEEVAGYGGSFGFDGPWTGDPTFTLANGSLIPPVPLEAISGNSVTADAAFGNRDLARPLAEPIGLDHTVHYLSFVMRAEDIVGDGAFAGWFGFVLRAGARNVTIGKSSFHDVYKVEGNLGDIGLSTIPVVTGETHLFVLRSEFLPGADSFSLYIDPPIGGPEPSQPSAVMNTFDVGLVTEIGLAGPGAFGFDELRIGNTWEDVTPVS